MCLDDSLYVVFTRAKNMGWFRRFLHPDISHCYAMWPDGDKWLVVDTAINKTSVFTLTDRNDIIGEIVKVDVKDGGRFFGINTCVSSVKRLIGCTNPFILTPYQLYKRIK